MTIQEAKAILAANGRSTCSCKYGGDEGNMINEAIKIKKSQDKKKKKPTFMGRVSINYNVF